MAYPKPHAPPAAPATWQTAFTAALDRDDLARAVLLAPAALHPLVAALVAAAAIPQADRRLVQLLGLAIPAAASAVRAARERQIAAVLDSRDPPGTLAGCPAGWYWALGGQPERARASVRRHLAAHPDDASAWELLAQFEPLRAHALIAFMGGPIDPAAMGLLADCDDDLPPAYWLAVYGWLAGEVSTADLRLVLGDDGGRLDPVAGDGRAFAAWIVEAERDPGDLQARRALKAIHAPTFQLWLRRCTAG